MTRRRTSDSSKRHRRKPENWAQHMSKALDSNAQIVRRGAVLMILVLIMNPLMLITMRNLVLPKTPDTFCEEFVLDVDGGAQCTADRQNTMVFLPEIVVSGRKCKGELNQNFFNAPLISVWATSEYDLRQDDNVWHLITSPAQAGLNTLYPTGGSQWSWIIRSNSLVPPRSPMSAISSMPGPVNLVACLEPNGNVLNRARGMTLLEPDFRAMCANIATWCGSTCNYAGDVDMPTCRDKRIHGTTWAQKYKVDCVSNKPEAAAGDIFSTTEGATTSATVSSTRVSAKSYFGDDDYQERLEEQDDDTDDTFLWHARNRKRLRGAVITPNNNSTLVILTDGRNASWFGNDNVTCSSSWAASTSDATTATFEFDTIDSYDLFAVGCTVFFDALLVLGVLPLLPSHKKEHHHGLYAKRMLHFQYGLHDYKFFDLLQSGNVRALCFVTPRVTEPDFKEQMESTCETMNLLAKRLASCSVTWPVRLVVCVIDEDRRPPAFEQLCTDQETGQQFYRTELLQMIEECSRDPRCSWFPGSKPEFKTPSPGGHYRIYTRQVSDTISVEFHYIRRGWRPPRELSVVEKMLGFGERMALAVNDHVSYTLEDNGSTLYGVVKSISPTGQVTVIKERLTRSRTSSRHEDQHPPEEVEVSAKKVKKLIQGAGKGAALEESYELLRRTLTEHSEEDTAHECGNMLACVIDARHHIVAQLHFWNTLLGPWWVEEEWGFDQNLQYVQVSQNLVVPQHYWLGQQNRMWYSFLSVSLSAIGAVSSSGSGSITRIPLDREGFTAFKHHCLKVKSNTEDFLESLMLLIHGATGAYVCNYDYTKAKGKDAMLSAYLRWEGGNMAVASRKIVLLQAFFGLLAVATVAMIAVAPLAAILIYRTWKAAAFAAFLTLSFTTIVLSVLTSTRGAARFVRTITVHHLCFRAIVNPLIGVLGALLVFALPFFSAVAGHTPLQLTGVNFPWTLLIRTVVVGLLQGFTQTGALATDWLRNDILQQVIEIKLEAEKFVRLFLPKVEAVAKFSGHHLKLRTASTRDAKKFIDEYAARMNEGVDPRDIDLNRICVLHTRAVWIDACVEWLLQTLYQLNQLTMQPGKGIMSLTRGLQEMFSRLVMKMDTSGWKSVALEKVVFGIPILNEIFLIVVIFPYPTSVSKFLMFFLLTWAVRIGAFVWVEEVLGFWVRDGQHKSVLTWIFLIVHIYAWFQVSDLI